MRRVIPLLIAVTTPAFAQAPVEDQGVAPDCWMRDPAAKSPDPAIYGRSGICRELGQLSTAERQMVVEASYTVIEGGLIDLASVQLVRWHGGDEATAEQLLRTLTLTVIRCSGGGSVFMPGTLMARLNGPNAVVEFLP